MPFHRLDRVGFRARLGAVTAFACAFALAGCGGNGNGNENTIPRDAGADIVAQLDQLKAQVEAGECETAAATADSIEDTISGLPSDVDGKLRETLQTASGNLQTQTRDPNQCEEPPEEPEPDPEPPPGATGIEGATGEEEG
jgi:hypothetical protein